MHDWGITTTACRPLAGAGQVDHLPIPQQWQMMIVQPQPSWSLKAVLLPWPGGKASAGPTGGA